MFDALVFTVFVVVAASFYTARSALRRPILEGVEIIALIAILSVYPSYLFFRYGFQHGFLFQSFKTVSEICLLYAIFSFLRRNDHIGRWGFRGVILGAGLNYLVVALNGGVMPIVSFGQETIFYKHMHTGTVASFFGDWIFLPSAPHIFVFVRWVSPGDILMVVGFLVFAFEIARTRFRTPRACIDTRK